MRPENYTGASAKEILERSRALGWKVAVAESCTGGMVAAALTDIPGASDVFDRGFITYADEAKTEMLGVPERLIARYGAVSAPVARAMAEGALLRAQVDIAIAVTGIAGPDGGTPKKPVGRVYIALASRHGQGHYRAFLFKGNRAAIRQAATEAALGILLEATRGVPPQGKKPPRRRGR